MPYITLKIRKRTVIITSLLIISLIIGFLLVSYIEANTVPKKDFNFNIIVDNYTIIYSVNTQNARFEYVEIWSNELIVAGTHTVYPKTNTYFLIHFNLKYSGNRYNISIEWITYYLSSFKSCKIYLKTWNSDLFREDKYLILELNETGLFKFNKVLTVSSWFRIHVEYESKTLLPRAGNNMIQIKIRRL